jgi:hypothetical protein
MAVAVLARCGSSCAIVSPRRRQLKAVSPQLAHKGAPEIGRDWRAVGRRRELGQLPQFRRGIKNKTLSEFRHLHHPYEKAASVVLTAG